MSQHILLIGAGLSTNHLIAYLANHAVENDWHITITDRDGNLAQSKAHFPRVNALTLDTNQYDELESQVSKHDLVISMLPAHMHLPVAKACLKYRKHLVTASYLSPEMLAMNEEVKQAGLLFLNEIGLDPGLDHLTAIKLIEQLKSEQCEIIEFESYTGGLVSLENDNNPWHYKFTWNPRNVVLAGQGGPAKFLQENKIKYIPYHRLFKNITPIEIAEYGNFEGYANRDSLKYQSAYGLNSAQTMIRGTLRRPGFCEAWDVFVQLGITDDSYTLDNSDSLTYRDFMSIFIPFNAAKSLEQSLKDYLSIKDEFLWQKLEWLDLFKPILIELKQATPAQILQHILERKLKIEKHEKDMIVMWHKLVFKQAGEIKQLHANIVIEGENQSLTAISKTVGLPLGVATKLILQNKIQERGTLIPITKTFYEQILPELEQLGIVMKHQFQ